MSLVFFAVGIMRGADEQPGRLTLLDAPTCPIWQNRITGPRGSRQSTLVPRPVE